MKSLRYLYKKGNGPSSSHTMGPKLATEAFLKKYGDCDYINVTLYGSLALTGKGHLTDEVIKKTIGNISNDILFNYDEEIPHPNTMRFLGYKNKMLIGEMVVYSVGGGEILIKNQIKREKDEIYMLNSFKEILLYCKNNNKRLYEYVDQCEDLYFNEFMEEIYLAMENAIDSGLKKEGILPGKLKINRKAKLLFNEKKVGELSFDEERRKLIAYAYAVSEENASGGEVVTSPTCGASGVLPAVMRYEEDLGLYSHGKVLNALKTAGLIGNLVKQNGSISGAEAGCQAEIGTACMMAAAFVSELNGESLENIAQAAEIALEHHLGLTCDPVMGYVQIPCIERNAVAALRALDAAKLASYIDSSEVKISLDTVISTMLETGNDLSSEYKETSEGGLAKKYILK